MKDTIKSKEGYRVINVRFSAIFPAWISIVFDGTRPLFTAEKRSYNEYQDEKRNNESFSQYEVFTTVKGNQFIYWRDEEIDADYITKVPTEDTCNEN